jgi:hypothetical protein
MWSGRKHSKGEGHGHGEYQVTAEVGQESCDANPEMVQQGLGKRDEQYADGLMPDS